jgi:hypothetical protein
MTETNDNVLLVFGASDELIELGGAIEDEFDSYDVSTRLIVLSDIGDAEPQAVATLVLSYDGVWSIEVERQAVGVEVEVIPATDLDDLGLPADEDGCPAYSAKAIIRSTIGPITGVITTEVHR